MDKEEGLSLFGLRGRYTEQQARTARRSYQPAQKRFAATKKAGRMGLERNGTHYGTQMQNLGNKTKKATVEGSLFKSLTCCF